MNLLIAPDSFKGTISAERVAALIAGAARSVWPDVQVDLAPIADGGEGTADALVGACGGHIELVRVSDPLGDPVEARLGWLSEDRAVVELAQASGLTLIDAARRNPMRASSRGTGELIAHALARGAREIVVSIGGSATNDGGMGLLRALGARFLDGSGGEVAEGGRGLIDLHRIDLSGLNPALTAAKLTVMCDVNNPLTGVRGATQVYGPQKGADPGMIEALERGMIHYARVLREQLGRAVDDFPGAGAAGGVGAALGGVLGAPMKPGIDAVLDAVRFDERLSRADLCVTGEGSLDGQSIAYGKAVAGVAARCAVRNVPLAVVAGGVRGDFSALYRLADASVMSCVSAPMPLHDALEEAEPLLQNAAERMFRFIDIGMGIAASGRVHADR